MRYELFKFPIFWFFSFLLFFSFLFVFKPIILGALTFFGPRNYGSAHGFYFSRIPMNGPAINGLGDCQMAIYNRNGLAWVA